MPQVCSQNSPGRVPADSSHRAIQAIHNSYPDSINMTQSRQIQGSIVALVTPMDATGAIDWQAWEALLNWHAVSGTGAVVVGGTTGESGCLLNREFEQLTRQAVAQFGPHGAVIMGVGSPATMKAIKLIRIAEQCGADAVLAVTPYYNRPPPAGMLAHYRALADASELPVIAYNVPGRTGVDLQPDTFAGIKQHDNILGLKEANAQPGRLSALLNLPGRRVSIFSGDDPSACDSLLQGAQGVVSVAANVLPRTFARLCRLALAGQDNQAQAEQARELDKRLHSIYDFLGCCSNPIPAKWYLNRLGLIQNGIRLPLIWLPAELENQAEKIYEQYRNIDNEQPD